MPLRSQDIAPQCMPRQKVRHQHHLGTKLTLIQHESGKASTRIRRYSGTASARIRNCFDTKSSILTLIRQSFNGKRTHLATFDNVRYCLTRTGALSTIILHSSTRARTRPDIAGDPCRYRRASPWTLTRSQFPSASRKHDAESSLPDKFVIRVLSPT